MDLSFIEKLKFILDVISNKQNQKVGEEYYQNYKTFLIEIDLIDNMSISDTDKVILKNLKVGALTGARNSNFEEFLFFKEFSPTDKLFMNYWSFVRNKSAFNLIGSQDSTRSLSVLFWGEIRTHIFYLVFMLIFSLVASFLLWVLVEQILNHVGELSLSNTITAVIIGLATIFLVITVSRLFYEYNAFSLLVKQIKK